MNYNEKLIEEIKNGFQKNKGKGSIFLCEPINIYLVIFSFIISIKNKNANSNILVLTNTSEQREKVFDCINTLNEDNRNYYNNGLCILSKKYIKPENLCHYNYRLIITVGINDINDINYILNAEKASKFTLSIITENLMNNEFTTKVREVLPDIVTTAANPIEARNSIISSPVEEIRCKIYLTDNELKKYTEYNNYIKDSMSIFGDLDTVNKCRIGDIEHRKSAMDVRLELAKANGWSYDIDCTIDFMKNIDAVYNPNAIAERADNVYNIIRERRNLILNAENKIEKILDIVEKEINNNNKVIVISKSGEFAHKITESINTKFGNDTCVDYHDCIPDSYVKDKDGKVITYKTGAKKGQPKVFKSKSLSNLYLNYFNLGYSKVLSIKNSSSNDLKTAANTIILTSSLIENIVEIRKRFVNIDFSVNTKVYRLYCDNTIEEMELINEKPNNFIKIKNETIENINYDSESGEITI